MAKDLPYFKFFCSEWSDGDITLESYESQGLFINICSYYWSNECEVNYKKLLKKFRGYEDVINQLKEENIFKVGNNEEISISFLDEQKNDRKEKSKIKAKGGKASAEARKLKKEQEVNTTLTENEHVLNSCSTETQLLREEKRREEEIREDNLLKIDASQIKSFKDKILSEVEQKNIVSKAKAEVEKRGGKWVCDYDFNPYDVLGRQFTNWNRICVEGKYTFEDVNHIKNVFYKFVVEYWEFNYDAIISKRKTKFKKQYTKK